MAKSKKTKVTKKKLYLNISEVNNGYTVRIDGEFDDWGNSAETYVFVDLDEVVNFIVNKFVE